MSQISVCDREPHHHRPVLLSIENLRPLTRRQNNMSQHTLPLKAPSKQPVVALSRKPSQATTLARPPPTIAAPASMTQTATPAPYPSNFPPKSLSRKYSTLPLDTHRYISNASIPPQLGANRYTSSYCFPTQQPQPIANNAPNMVYGGNDLRNPFGNPMDNCLLATENSGQKDKDSLPVKASTSEECTANDCLPATPAPSLAWAPPPARINPRTFFVMKPQNLGAYRRLPGQRPCDPPCFSTTLHNRSNVPPLGSMPQTFHPAPLPPPPNWSYYNSDPTMAAYGALGDCNSRRATTPFLPYKPIGGRVNGRGDDEYSEFNAYNNYYYH
ncbi:unnamed protein product [Allacma fusca]|uniref:Uncharacterized protein n=1 Tax=Allacma fusca TaxID=39272 RepID=A0A8J2JDB2_9HEXA|nr:unnamed protein product [Allacma fusca]